jgi:hypothetical protein
VNVRMNVKITVKIKVNVNADISPLLTWASRDC